MKKFFRTVSASGGVSIESNRSASAARSLGRPWLVPYCRYSGSPARRARRSTADRTAGTGSVWLSVNPAASESSLGFSSISFMSWAMVGDWAR